MITITQYWMGRDKQFPKDWSDAVQIDGAETVRRWNLVLDRFGEETGINCSTVAGGWRPVAVNDHTSNAGLHSNHIKARAGDVADTPARALAHWCMANLDFMEEIGLWFEDPRWTGGPGHTPWVHGQIVPPASGKRVYIPSVNPPLDPNFPVTWS